MCPTKLIELSLIDQRKEVDGNIFSPRPQVQSDKQSISGVIKKQRSVQSQDR